MPTRMATEQHPPAFSPTARIVYSPAGDSRAPVRGVVYKKADGVPLEGDLYLPLRSPAPAILLVHGALPEGIPVAPKDWGQFLSWGEAIAACGMAAFAFNHRMRWNNGFVPGSVAAAEQDLSDAIGFLHANADRYGIDPGRIAVMAFSAGGPLLASLIRQHPSYLRCLVGFYAVLGDPHPGTSDAGRFSAIDAAGSGADVPPIFVAKAGKDMPFLNAGIDQFVQALSRAGADHEFIEHPDGWHGFDVNNDDDTSRKIIQRAIEFMKSRLAR